MRRSLLIIIFGTLAVGGVTLAQHGKGGVKTLSQKDITEKIDGKKAMATTVEVTLAPGESGAPHRHPGPAFGYVLEGEYEWAIDDNPARTPFLLFR
jgi:quercetin dioxygenase-like cupin family protein